VNLLNNEYQKHLLDRVTQVAITSFPRMIHMYSALLSYFMSIEKSTAVLKCCFGNYLNEH